MSDLRRQIEKLNLDLRQAVRVTWPTSLMQPVALGLVERFILVLSLMADELEKKTNGKAEN